MPDSPSSILASPTLQHTKQPVFRQVNKLFCLHINARRFSCFYLQIFFIFLSGISAYSAIHVYIIKTNRKAKHVKMQQLISHFINIQVVILGLVKVKLFRCRVLSQRHFPKRQLTKGNFPSGNFPYVQFPKQQFPKSLSQPQRSATNIFQLGITSEYLT